MPFYFNLEDANRATAYLSVTAKSIGWFLGLLVYGIVLYRSRPTHSYGQQSNKNLILPMYRPAMLAIQCAMFCHTILYLFVSILGVTIQFSHILLWVLFEVVCEGFTLILLQHSLNYVAQTRALLPLAGWMVYAVLFAVLSINNILFDYTLWSALFHLFPACFHLYIAIPWRADVITPKRQTLRAYSTWMSLYRLIYCAFYLFEYFAYVFGSDGESATTGGVGGFIFVFFILIILAELPFVLIFYIVMIADTRYWHLGGRLMSRGTRTSRRNKQPQTGFDVSAYLKNLEDENATNYQNSLQNQGKAPSFLNVPGDNAIANQYYMYDDNINTSTTTGNNPNNNDGMCLNSNINFANAAGNSANVGDSHEPHAVEILFRKHKIESSPSFDDISTSSDLISTSSAKPSALNSIIVQPQSLPPPTDLQQLSNSTDLPQPTPSPTPSPNTDAKNNDLEQTLADNIVSQFLQDHSLLQEVTDITNTLTVIAPSTGTNTSGSSGNNGLTSVTGTNNNSNSVGPNGSGLTVDTSLHNTRPRRNTKLPPLSPRLLPTTTNQLINEELSHITPSHLITPSAGKGISFFGQSVPNNGSGNVMLTKSSRRRTGSKDTEVLASLETLSPPPSTTNAANVPMAPVIDPTTGKRLNTQQQLQLNLLQQAPRNSLIPLPQSSLPPLYSSHHPSNSLSQNSMNNGSHDSAAKLSRGGQPPRRRSAIPSHDADHDDGDDTHLDKKMLTKLHQPSDDFSSTHNISTTNISQINDGNAINNISPSDHTITIGDYEDDDDINEYSTHEDFTWRYFLCSFDCLDFLTRGILSLLYADDDGDYDIQDGDGVLGRMDLGVLSDANDDIVQGELQELIDQNSRHLVHYLQLHLDHSKLLGAGSYSKVFGGEIALNSHQLRERKKYILPARPLFISLYDLFLSYHQAREKMFWKILHLQYQPQQHDYSGFGSGMSSSQRPSSPTDDEYKYNGHYGKSTHNNKDSYNSYFKKDGFDDDDNTDSTSPFATGNSFKNVGQTQSAPQRAHPLLTDMFNAPGTTPSPDDVIKPTAAQATNIAAHQLLQAQPLHDLLLSSTSDEFHVNLTIIPKKVNALPLLQNMMPIFENSESGSDDEEEYGDNTITFNTTTFINPINNASSNQGISNINNSAPKGEYYNTISAGMNSSNPALNNTITNQTLHTADLNTPQPHSATSSLPSDHSAMNNYTSLHDLFNDPVMNNTAIQTINPTIVGNNNNTSGGTFSGNTPILLNPNSVVPANLNLSTASIQSMPNLPTNPGLLPQNPPAMTGLINNLGSIMPNLDMSLIELAMQPTEVFLQQAKNNNVVGPSTTTPTVSTSDTSTLSLPSSANAMQQQQQMLITAPLNLISPAAMPLPLSSQSAASSTIMPQPFISSISQTTAGSVAVAIPPLQPLPPIPPVAFPHPVPFPNPLPPIHAITYTTSAQSSSSQPLPQLPPQSQQQQSLSVNQHAKMLVTYSPPPIDLSDVLRPVVYHQQQQQLHTHEYKITGQQPFYSAQLSSDVNLNPSRITVKRMSSPQAVIDYLVSLNDSALINKSRMNRPMSISNPYSTSPNQSSQSTNIPLWRHIDQISMLDTMGIWSKQFSIFAVLNHQRLILDVPHLLYVQTCLLQIEGHSYLHPQEQLPFLSTFANQDEINRYLQHRALATVMLTSTFKSMGSIEQVIGLWTRSLNIKQWSLQDTSKYIYMMNSNNNSSQQPSSAASTVSGPVYHPSQSSMSLQHSISKLPTSPTKLSVVASNTSQLQTNSTTSSSLLSTPGLNRKNSTISKPSIPASPMIKFPANCTLPSSPSTTITINGNGKMAILSQEQANTINNTDPYTTLPYNAASTFSLINTTQSVISQTTSDKKDGNRSNHMTVLTNTDQNHSFVKSTTNISGGNGSNDGNTNGKNGVTASPNPNDPQDLFANRKVVFPIAAKFFLRTAELDIATVKSFSTETILHSSLKHINVVWLYGLCVVPPAISIISEECRRGCLMDLIEQQIKFKTALLREIIVSNTYKKILVDSFLTPNHAHFLSVSSQSKRYQYLNNYNMSQARLIHISAFLWSLRDRLCLAKDCAAGIAYIHKKQILHRDIKSPNYLLTDDFRVKLTDFGISRKIAMPYEDYYAMINNRRKEVTGMSLEYKLINNKSKKQVALEWHFFEKQLQQQYQLYQLSAATPTSATGMVNLSALHMFSPTTQQQYMKHANSANNISNGSLSSPNASPHSLTHTPRYREMQRQIELVHLYNNVTQSELLEEDDVLIDICASIAETPAPVSINKNDRHGTSSSSLLTALTHHNNKNNNSSSNTTNNSTSPPKRVIIQSTHDITKEFKTVLQHSTQSSYQSNPPMLTPQSSVGGNFPNPSNLTVNTAVANSAHSFFGSQSSYSAPPSFMHQLSSPSHQFNPPPPQYNLQNVFDLMQTTALSMKNGNGYNLVENNPIQVDFSCSEMILYHIRQSLSGVSKLQTKPPVFRPVTPGQSSTSDLDLFKATRDQDCQDLKFDQHSADFGLTDWIKHTNIPTILSGSGIRNKKNTQTQTQQKINNLESIPDSYYTNPMYNEMNFFLRTQNSFLFPMSVDAGLIDIMKTNMSKNNFNKKSSTNNTPSGTSNTHLPQSTAPSSIPSSRSSSQAPLTNHRPQISPSVQPQTVTTSPISTNGSTVTPLSTLLSADHFFSTQRIPPHLLHHNSTSSLTDSVKQFQTYKTLRDTMRKNGNNFGTNKGPQPSLQSLQFPHNTPSNNKDPMNVIPQSTAPGSTNIQGPSNNNIHTLSFPHITNQYLTSNMGTSVWMAPEVWMQGNLPPPPQHPTQSPGGGYSYPADIFSLGMVLYELICLQAPPEPPPILTSADNNGQPIKYPEFNLYFPPDVPFYIQQLILSCLSFNPLARPSATDVVNVLTIFIELIDAKQLF